MRTFYSSAGIKYNDFNFNDVFRVNVYFSVYFLFVYTKYMMSMEPWAAAKKDLS